MAAKKTTSKPKEKAVKPAKKVTGTATPEQVAAGTAGNPVSFVLPSGN